MLHILDIHRLFWIFSLARLLHWNLFFFNYFIKIQLRKTVISLFFNFIICKSEIFFFVGRWDPQARQWSFVASMATPRSTVGVAVLNGK